MNVKGIQPIQVNRAKVTGNPTSFREHWDTLEGYDSGFASPGGGLVTRKFQVQYAGFSNTLDGS